MRSFLPLLALAVASASAQIPTPSAGQLLLPVQFPVPASDAENGAQELLDFKDSDIRFSLERLMDILRDHQHEGWVLAAYPDPNTRRPWEHGL